MKHYIGTKEVKAEPITLGEFITQYGRNPYPNRIEPYDDNYEGYLVEYEDGYKSFSPKDVFEKAYKCSETYIDRLHIELEDLIDKATKLKKFIESDKFETLVTNEDKQVLMKGQYDLMKNYIDILKTRIKLED